jgi:ABC-2 type transport system ATP-binding protein
MRDLRTQHRIVAQLRGQLPPIPEQFNGQLVVAQNGDDEVVLQTPGELAPLLGWLATLPLADIRIEPVGLRAVYDRFHTR